MEHNLNNKDKRIRKRIAVKEDLFSKSIHDSNRGKSPETADSNGAVFSRNNHKPYNNKRNFNRPSMPFDKKNQKTKNYEIEDPTLKHQIFNRQEGKPQIFVKADFDAKKQDGQVLIRLNKFISNAGVCSRREADDLIQKGLIKVNGNVVSELGFKVSPKDKVECRGKLLAEANHVYILLNKPKDTITTTNDPENRMTVMDLVKKATDQRIFPIGRLDRNTTGVLLLTNDGDFAQKLSHPSSEIRKVYYAELDKPLDKDHLEQLIKGVELEDGMMNADEIAYVDPKDSSMIGIEIHSGKNRIIHRMFESLGYRVKKLDRVVYAGLDKGGLRRSKWRFLRYDEVQNVLNAIKYDNEKKA